MRGYNPVDIVAQVKNTPDLGRRVGAEDPRRAARARPARRARGGDALPGASLDAALVAFPEDSSNVRPEVLGVRRRRRSARQLARSVLGRTGVRRRPGLRPDRDRADRQPESSVRHEEGLGRQGDGRRRREDRGRRRDSGPRRERHARLLQRRGGNGARVRGRLVPHGRHRRNRPRRRAVHPRPQEGNDRHAGRAERLSGRRRERAQPDSRRARLRGRRRASCRNPGSSAERVHAVVVLDPGSTWTRSCAPPTAGSTIISASGARSSGPKGSCRAPRARGNSSARQSATGSSAAGRRRSRSPAAIGSPRSSRNTRAGRTCSRARRSRSWGSARSSASS